MLYSTLIKLEALLAFSLWEKEKGELKNEELYIKPQDLEDKIDQILHLLQDNNKAQSSLQLTLQVQASQQKTWAQITSFPPTSPTQRTGDWTLV